ncbi:hypothetical protein D2T29_00180 [Sinirhodobacter populi]|uniref:Uncharacterized protein n=1 Tax=Paenirhodobacter populi TaxID=2306993 RepID=A0A443KPR0_9RHOB|nr:hypothetical protein D2T29_00180 [Sinirhodobacter populi]
MREGRSLRRISATRLIKAAVFDFNAQPRESLSDGLDRHEALRQGQMTGLGQMRHQRLRPRRG